MIKGWKRVTTIEGRNAAFVNFDNIWLIMKISWKEDDDDVVYAGSKLFTFDDSFEVRERPEMLMGYVDD